MPAQGIDLVGHGLLIEGFLKLGQPLRLEGGKIIGFGEVSVEVVELPFVLGRIPSGQPRRAGQPGEQRAEGGGQPPVLGGLMPMSS
jgi:hypothetical protein